MRKHYLKRSKLLMLVLSIMMSSLAYAQSRVSGTVTDQQNQPLPGVNVLVKGSTQGTTTDASGKYQVEVLTSDAILTFSFIGFTSQEKAVGNQTVVDVTLQEDIQNLQEVVVVGYGTVKKSDLTGSISSVKADAFKDMPVISVDQALQARAAGVNVTQSSSAPGGGLSVRVRGANSLISGSQPLYVIDGLPIYPDSSAFGTNGNRQAGNAMASLSPNEIESLET